MKKLILSAFSAATVMGLLQSTAEACNGCMGTPDSNLAPALGGAILTLAGLLTIVGGIFLKFLFFLAKRDGLPLPQESAQS